MFARFALYYTLPPGALAEALGEWLGWDAVSGTERQHPDLRNLPGTVRELTDRPRKYGAHATMKPPFFLAPGKNQRSLEHAFEAFVADQAVVTLEGLEISVIGRFLALTARGNTDAVKALAAATVRHFDDFRAAPSDMEREKRRRNHLSPGQRANLAEWGYAHVMDDFRFHITLTGPLNPQHVDTVKQALSDYLRPLLPKPLVIDALSLLGSDPETGRFHLIRREALSAKTR